MQETKIPCLFCYSTNISMAAFPRPTTFNMKVFSYNQCNDCGLVFINPLPATDDYDKMYAKSYHSEFYFKDIPDYSNWLQLFEKYGQEKMVLDYGCGDGAFLKFFKQKGYDCIGIEYDPELVARLKTENPGMTFYTVDEFWSINHEVQYDKIFMGDVLEHMAKPRDFLEKLFIKIKPGGLIAAQGPLENNTSLALRFRKAVSGLKTSITRSSKAIHIPYHIFFSNAVIQKAIFERTGLSTLYYHVFETAWPFPARLSIAPGVIFKYLIARSSILVSKITPGQTGNRFLYMGKKK